MGIGEVMIEKVLKNDLGDVAYWLQGNGELFNIDEYNHFDMPTQIIYGEFDKTGMVIKYSKNWAKKENYPLHIIDNALYNSNVDNPEAFNKLLDNFLTVL